MIEENYRGVIGKTHDNTVLISFARCDCGMLLLTPPDNHGNPAECASCRLARESSGAIMVRRPRRESRALLLVAVLAFMAFSWVGVSMQRAPDRPAAEGVGW